MKELFRERDAVRVGFLQSILEAEGIATYVKNQDSTGITGSVALPKFYPALCVVNDEDYGAAMEILREHVQIDASVSQEEIPCPKCGEGNPANFDICWSCGAGLR